MGIRYEVWTLPWMGDFKRKIANLPVIEGTGSGSVGLFETTGRGSASLAKFDRFSEVVSDSEGSLIWVFDGSSVIDEWTADRDSITHKDDGRIDLSGGRLSAYFDKQLVKPYDGLNPTSQGDWVWGGDNLLADPGITTTPKSFELVITATGGTYTLNDGTDTTAVIAFDAQAGTIETRIQTDLGKFSDIIVAPAGSSPRKFVLTMVTPPFGVNLGIGVGSLTGGTGTTTTTEEGGVEFSGWDKAGTLARGAPQNVSGYTEFRPSTAQVLTDDYSLLIDAAPSTATSNRWPGAQRVLSTTSGIGQASIPVYPTSGTDKFRLAILGMGEEVIAVSSSSGTTLTPNTWNTISISDFQIPDGITQVIFRVQCTNVGPSNPSPFYVGIYDAVFRMGLPVTDPGNIATALFDARADGVFDWIDYTTISGTDSGSLAWAEDIALTVQWGQSYGQFLDQLTDLGLEWALTPKATPVGLKTHDFFLYQTAGYDSAPGVAVNAKHDKGGSVIKRVPEFTNVLVEGADGAWTEDSDAAAEANFGILEKFYANRELMDATTRQAAADNLLAFEQANRTAVEFDVYASAHPRPLVDYKPGDTISVQLPPGLTKQDRRIQRIDYTNTNPTQYKIVGSRILNGEAAAYNLVNRLWRRFNRPERLEASPPSLGGGTGGAFTIQIAASDAQETEKAKADFVCTGVKDLDLIQEVATAMKAENSAGRILLSSGTFNHTVSANNQTLLGLNPSEGLIVQGQGMFSTKIQIDTAGFDGTSIINGAARMVFRDFGITGGASTIGTALYVDGYSRVDNVRLATSFDGLQVAGVNVMITNSIFENDGVDLIDFGASSVTVSGCTIGGVNVYSMQLASNTGWRIVNNHILGRIDCYGITDFVLAGNKLGAEVFGTGNPERIVIANNTWTNAEVEATEGLIYFSGASQLVIANNIAEPANYTFARLESCQYVTITGNHTTYTEWFVWSEFLDHFLIEGNNSYAAGKDGLYLKDANRGFVNGNFFNSVGSTTNDTYDGVQLTGTCTDVDVHSNKFAYLSAVHATKKPRWAVNVGASCTGISYVGNISGPSADYGRNAAATTTPYNNAGTGTINTWPGAAAPQGDNLL